MAPTISVIIPTYNEGKILTQTLAYTSKSVVSEIVVVDGGSTDGTVQMAESSCTSIPHTRVMTTSRGRAHQMNEGAKASRGEVLLFLHADTQLPALAHRLIESALADPKVVGGRFDVRFDNPSVWGRIISTFMNLRSRVTSISTGDQAMFVRRHVFEQLGGFSEIPLMEDIEFSARLKRVGLTAALHKTVITSFRRWEQGGPVRTILLMWMLRFLHWVGVSPSRLNRWYDMIR